MTASRGRKWLGRQVTFLGSGRLAIVLLSALVALLSLYLFVPQQGQMEAEALELWIRQRGVLGRALDILGLTDVQHSWLLSGTWGLLFVNLLVCMTRRFRTTLLSCRFPEEPPSFSTFRLHREVARAGARDAEVAEWLRRKGYRTLVGPDAVYGLRGRFAMVGHWVFHVSLLLLLAAGFLVAVGPDSFRGTVGIGEGEPFDLHTSPLLSTNGLLSSELPELKLQLEKIDVVTEGRAVRHFDVRLLTADGHQVVAGINRPYRKRPYQMLVHGFGYMPGWAIVNARKRMLAGAWVKLTPFPLRAEDSFPLDEDGSTVQVYFYPDHERDGEFDRSRSRLLLNPRFKARISYRGQQIYDGLLKPDERVPLGNGREFFFLPEIRRYALLDIIHERGYEFVFTCFGLMIAGLFLRYARIRKEIAVELREGSLHVFGRSEILEDLFEEELDRLAAELARTELHPHDQGGAA
jgi:hypothetical protein